MPKPPHTPGPKSTHDEERKQRDLGVSGASVESVPRRKRRKFTASEKLRLIKAAEAAIASGERGALEALLRREAIYGSHLSAWRQQLAAHGTAGLTSRKPGRKPKIDENERKALLALTKRNAELERKLAIANALIELQKAPRKHKLPSGGHARPRQVYIILNSRKYAVRSVFHDSHFYDTFECSDGKWVTLGALEPQFYAVLVDKLGLSAELGASQFDVARWPEHKARLAARIKEKTRDEWTAILEGTDACYAPVLTIPEAARHPHNVARGTFAIEGDKYRAAVAPRFIKR